MGSTAGPDVLEKRQTSFVPGFEPRTVQSLAQSLYRLSNPIPFRNTYRCVLLIILI